MSIYLTNDNKEEGFFKHHKTQLIVNILKDVKNKDFKINTNKIKFDIHKNKGILSLNGKQIRNLLSNYRSLSLSRIKFITTEINISNISFMDFYYRYLNYPETVSYLIYISFPWFNKFLNNLGYNSSLSVQGFDSFLDCFNSDDIHQYIENIYNFINKNYNLLDYNIIINKKIIFDYDPFGLTGNITFNSLVNVIKSPGDQTDLIYDSLGSEILGNKVIYFSNSLDLDDIKSLFSDLSDIVYEFSNVRIIFDEDNILDSITSLVRGIDDIIDPNNEDFNKLYLLSIVLIIYAKKIEVYEGILNEFNTIHSLLSMVNPVNFKELVLLLFGNDNFKINITGDNKTNISEINNIIYKNKYVLNI